MAYRMAKPLSITYADAGVDIERANRTKQRIKFLAHRTFTRGVLSEIGGFGGLFALDKKRYRNPVLVSSVDGVGTKLKVAFAMKFHQSVGGDLVNHCVNDIAVQGATPLFFMDYLATGKLEPGVAEKVISGITEACRHNNCALIGGETAEMPGFYPPGEYDLAGFIVGVVDREHILTGSKVAVGDILIGLPSAGLHTNGYSLARKLLFEVAGYSPKSYVNELKNKVGNELLRPHKSYWPVLRRLLEADAVSALAHITGGGITENLPRVLPRGTAAVVELGTWPVRPIFTHLQKLGNISQAEMLRTFNMGIGMVLVVPSKKFKKVMSLLERAGERGHTIGRIVNRLPSMKKTQDSMFARMMGVVRRIPRGRVSTYGDIAYAAGFPGRARQVAWALHASHGLPWHRVVGAGGKLLMPGEYGFEQRLRLEAEGVRFSGLRVRMELHRHAWFRSRRRRAGRAVPGRRGKGRAAD